MNNLLTQQKGQVQSFQSSAHRIQAQASSEAKRQVSALEKNLAYNSLKEQAFNNRHSLVIIGLKEDPSENVYSLLKDFFKNKLKLRYLEMRTAYRMGTPSDQDSAYCRPLLVKFFKVSDRNAVWRKRYNIPAEQGEKKIKVQADLPKTLH